MRCFNCGCQLSEKDFCTGCGVDVALYKKIMYTSNFFYNEGLEKANVRDLSGAVTSLRQSLKFNKYNIEARNLLGLVYYEMGEVVKGLNEWVISKNLRANKNIADDYINMIQENPNRLEMINQTIKKYNLALGYCQQDGLDLAVIQLKKVLSLNPNYIRAHQLLALLYMRSEEWEKAKRELEKCKRIDTGNTTTLRYSKEVEAMLDMAENARAGIKKRNRQDDIIKYQSGNETIIQPINNKDNRSVSTILNIGIGIAIGVAAACFLILPGRLNSVNTQAQNELRTISEQLDKKTSTIEGLEQQIALLSDENSKLNQELSDYVGTDGTMVVIDGLLEAVNVYIENPEDIVKIAQALEKIDTEAAGQIESGSFQKLYQMLLSQVGPSIANAYFESGQDSYQKEMYEAAVKDFEKAVEYDPNNGDILYNLGNAYRQSGDRENAIKTYELVIQNFEGTEKARRAQTYLDELKEG